MMKLNTFTRRLVAGFALAAGAVALSATPALADDPAPLLSVEMTTSAESVGAGGTVDFEVTVTNIGADAKDLRLDVEAPEAATVVRISDGTADGNTGSSTFDLASGTDHVATVTVTAGTAAEAETAMSVLASVYVGDAATPAVRAAGVVELTEAAAFALSSPLIFGLAAALVVVLGALGLLVWRRNVAADRAVANGAAEAPVAADVVSDVVPEAGEDSARREESAQV